MRNEEEEYNTRMKMLLEEKSRIVKQINILLKKYKGIELEIENLEDAEFVRTGSFTFSTEIEIKITELDLLKDLIRETEGKNINLDNPNDN